VLAGAGSPALDDEVFARAEAASRPSNSVTGTVIPPSGNVA
jgi:hypothetical protein